jgi:hypothetical protein
MDEYWLQIAVMFGPKFVLIGLLVWYTQRLRAEVRRAKEKQ